MDKLGKSLFCPVQLDYHMLSVNGLDLSIRKAIGIMGTVRYWTAHAPSKSSEAASQLQPPSTFRNTVSGFLNPPVLQEIQKYQVCCEISQFQNLSIFQHWILELWGPINCISLSYLSLEQIKRQEKKGYNQNITFLLENRTYLRTTGLFNIEPQNLNYPRVPSRNILSPGNRLQRGR